MSTIFPKWTNTLPPKIAVGGLLTATLVVAGAWYYFTPKYWAVGYQPKQPGGGFNHQLHAGKLGMDCRYCHTNVETSAEANLPNVATCYGCHADGRLAKLASSSDEPDAHKSKTNFIRDAYASDASIEWRRIHKVPDYVRNFPHNAHLNAGVSCISCHGNIARMEVVYQHEPLSMSWCLECHRDPEPHLAPKDGQFFNIFAQEERINKLKQEGLTAQGTQFFKERNIHAPENCSACHY